MLLLFRPQSLLPIPSWRISHIRLSLLRSLSVMPRHKSNSKKKGGAPKKPPLTHFLCIPLVNPVSRPQLEASISKFKEDVCSAALKGAVTESDVPKAKDEESETPKESDTPRTSNDSTLEGGRENPVSPSQAPAIVEKAIRPVGALHLTVGVMSLDEDKLAQAINLLETLDLSALLQGTTSQDSTAVIGPSSNPSGPENSSPGLPSTQPSEPTHTPLHLSLTGLTSMHSPAKTSILYISPHDPTSRLLPLCTYLRDQFLSAGLLIPDSRPLRLHATIVNTIYAKGRRRGKPSPSKPSESKPTESKPSESKPSESRPTERTSTPENPAAGSVNTVPPNRATDAGPHPLSSRETQPQSQATDERAIDDSSTGHGPNANAPLKIDARPILSKYTDYTWADHIPITRIAVCEMGAKKSVVDGKLVEAYTEVGVRWFSSLSHV